MRTWKRAQNALISAPSIFMILLLSSCRKESAPLPVGKDGWLKGETNGKMHIIAKHLRGNDVAMWEVGHRYQELYWGGLDGNWEYAEYELEKMELTMQLAIERRPKREPSYKIFFKEFLPPIRDAILQRDKKLFVEAFDQLTQGCNSCHTTENLAFFRIHKPEFKASLIRFKESG